MICLELLLPTATTSTTAAAAGTMDTTVTCTPVMASVVNHSNVHPHFPHTPTTRQGYL